MTVKEKIVTCKSGNVYKLRAIGWSKRNDIIDLVGTKTAGGLPQINKTAYSNQIIKAICVEPSLEIVNNELTVNGEVLDISDGDEIWQNSLELMGIATPDLAFLSKLTSQNATPQV